jgi:hypothetical protein
MQSLQLEGRNIKYIVLFFIRKRNPLLKTARKGRLQHMENTRTQLQDSVGGTRALYLKKKSSISILQHMAPFHF